MAWWVSQQGDLLPSLLPPPSEAVPIPTAPTLPPCSHIWAVSPWVQPRLLMHCLLLRAAPLRCRTEDDTCRHLSVPFLGIFCFLVVVVGF